MVGSLFAMRWGVPCDASQVLGLDDVAWNGKYRATWNPDATGFPCAVCTVRSVPEVRQVVRYAAEHCASAQ